jgi:FkbM family methyltransferase
MAPGIVPDQQPEHPGEMIFARRIAEHSFVPAWLGPSATVVDLGMNEGAFATAVARRFGCRVIGVEPNPVLARANRARGLRCRQLAIAPTPGSLRFRIDPHDSRSSRLLDAAEAAADGLEVPVVPLGQFLQAERIDAVQLLKMDIEGAELGIFETEPAVLERAEQISAEFHAFRFPDHRPRVEGILQAMARRGFFVMDFSLCLMDVLFINTRRRPLSWIDRQTLWLSKYREGLRRRLGLATG